MSRATISTGSMPFKVNEGDQPSAAPANRNDNFHIVTLADFSGRDHSGPNEVLSQRKIIAIDRDNFDDVFAQLKVQCDLPLADEPLAFAELDDMHPDFIYERVPLFEKLRQLKRKLKSPSSFAEAAAEIDEWGAVESSASATSGAASADANPPGGTLLDDILSRQGPAEPTRSFDVQALLKEIVSPYLSPKPDPKLEDYIRTVDAASSSLMRRLLHHDRFQALESAWRSLYLLVRRLETDEQLKLFIVDIPRQALIDDAANHENYKCSELYKLLVENRQALGASAFSVIMADAIFGPNEADIKALANIGEVARAIDAVFIAGGSEQFAGCESLAKTPLRDDWDFVLADGIDEKWLGLRAASQAQNITLVAPRFLGRMPYGKKTSPIDSFAFEELPSGGRHPYYLWCCGAWLLSLLLAENYSKASQGSVAEVNEIDGLPLHVYYDDDTEAQITPCAEVMMLDASASALRAAGLLPIRSVLNKDSVVIPSVCSISKLTS